MNALEAVEVDCFQAVSLRVTKAFPITEQNGRFGQSRVIA